MTTIHIDISDLVSNLGLEADLTEQLIDDVHVKMGLDLQAGLMLATPVDTGEARNGWHSDTQGRQTVVENRVPYINRLNEGWSKQAPAGFVENVIDDVTRRPL